MTYSRKNRNHKLRSTKLVLLLWVGLFLCLPDLEVLAQERKSNIIPGRVMVKFKFDEIELPAGETKADFGRVTIRSVDLKRILQSFEIDQFAKVVPTAVKGDTLRVLPDGRTVKIHDFSQLHLLRFPKEISVDSVVTVLQEFDQVIYAEPDQIPRSTATPDDEFFEDQRYLHQTNDKDIDAPEAWEKSKGDGIKIAIVDNDGVRTTHEDLDGKIEGGETTTDGNHGTQVAGVAAAETHDILPGEDPGIAGVGWNSKIIPYEFTGLSGAVNDINAAVSAGAHIINMSWVVDQFSTTLKNALDNAAVQGRTLVVSAGNFVDVLYPSAFDGLVIGVSGTDLSDNFREGWNFGGFVDVAAPGVGIKTTDGDDDSDYVTVNGTSYSAAIVSGIVALLRSFEPDLEDRDFERIIELSAEKVDAAQYPYNSNGWNDHLGHGRVNARQALDLVEANEIFHWTASGGSVNSISQVLVKFYDLPGGATETYYIGKRYEVIKTGVFSHSLFLPLLRFGAGWWVPWGIMPPAVASTTAFPGVSPLS